MAVADLFIAYDPKQPAGQRLAPEVRTEIATVAPSTVNNGAITTAKLAPAAVTTDKLANGAATSAKIATGGVETPNLKDAAVATAKIADAAVTPAKVGPGVVTSRDLSGNAFDIDMLPLTAAQYAAIATPNPNVLYLITDT
jgi:hypothetical protein